MGVVVGPERVRPAAGEGEAVGTAIVIMVVIIAAALGVAAVVVLGIEGRFSDRAPEVSERLARAAQHLNGEGAVPPRFERLFR